MLDVGWICGRLVIKYNIFNARSMYLAGWGCCCFSSSRLYFSKDRPYPCYIVPIFQKPNVWNFWCRLCLKSRQSLCASANSIRLDCELVCCVVQEWLDTRCQDTVCLVTPWTRLHVWNQLEKVALNSILRLGLYGILWHMTAFSKYYEFIACLLEF